MGAMFGSFGDVVVKEGEGIQMYNSCTIARWMVRD